MAEGKLGPKATYLGNNPDDKQAVTMAGVRFKPGEAVDLVKELGTRAEAILAKLAGNSFFKVDGGPDHAKLKAEHDKAQAKAAEEAAKEQESQSYTPPEEATLEKKEQPKEQPKPAPVKP
jgi:hypothetical protein